MEYRLLGSSGCAVSALALGTLTFGNETDQATSFSQLDRFTEAGGNLVDEVPVAGLGLQLGCGAALGGEEHRPGGAAEDLLSRAQVS